MTERDSTAPFLRQLRVIVVAGIVAGVVLVGVGSRLAMLLLRLTSPDTVRGVTSDDGFTIGEVTLFGTYNLLNLGAAVGLIGALAYWLVAPWLIGPTWFRRMTTGLAAGAVAGSMLIHADGVDFTALQPMWLAIGLFVALPAMFGWAIGVAVDHVEDEESWINRGRRRSILPLVLPVLFPISIFVLLFVTLALLVCWKLRALPIVQRISAAKSYGLAVRSTFLLIAALGFWALVGDIQALA